jgi:hypothetical protein
MQGMNELILPNIVDEQCLLACDENVFAFQALSLVITNVNF